MWGNNCQRGKAKLIALEEKKKKASGIYWMLGTMATSFSYNEAWRLGMTSLAPPWRCTLSGVQSTVVDG